MANGKTEYRLAFGADIYSEPVSNLRARIADIIRNLESGLLDVTTVAPTTLRVAYTQQELTRRRQQVENDFVGAHVGTMDPMVASLGREGSALLIDTKSGQHRFVPLPHSMDLIVVDSGLPHRNAEGEYNRRRAECDEARRLQDGSL